MINCLPGRRSRKWETPHLYRATGMIPKTSKTYFGVGTIVITYSNGVSQAFNMNGDDRLIVHAEHTARWIK